MYRLEERALGRGTQQLLQIHEHLAHRGAAGGSLTAEGSTLCPCLFSSLASHIILSEKPSFSFGETVLPTALPVTCLWVWTLSMTCASSVLGPASSSASAGKGQRAKPKLLPLSRGCFSDRCGKSPVGQWAGEAVEGSAEHFSPSSVSPAPPPYSLSCVSFLHRSTLPSMLIICLSSPPCELI